MTKNSPAEDCDTSICRKLFAAVPTSRSVQLSAPAAAPVVLHFFDQGCQKAARGGAVGGFWGALEVQKPSISRRRHAGLLRRRMFACGSRCSNGVGNVLSGMLSARDTPLPERLNMLVRSSRSVAGRGSGRSCGRGWPVWIRRVCREAVGSTGLSRHLPAPAPGRHDARLAFALVIWSATGDTSEFIRAADGARDAETTA